MYKLCNITFKEFEQVIKGFNTQNFDAAYNEILKRNISNNVQKLSKKDKEAILDFLNKWQCRIPKKDGAVGIGRAVMSVTGDVSSLTGCRLRDLNENKLETIRKIFESMSSEQVGKRTIGPTAASKLMHLLLPGTCIMWDDGISAHYGFAHNAEGYVRFLSEMLKLREAVLSDYNRQHQSADIQCAEDVICAKCGKLWFTKLIDEYNYGIAEDRIQKWKK